MLRGLRLVCLGLLAGCATQAPGKMYFVKPVKFPVNVQPTADSREGSVFPQEATGSLYSNQRFWQIGDIVTVAVMLSSSAQDNSSGSLTKSSTLGLAINQVMGLPLQFGRNAAGMPYSPSIGWSSNQQFTGTGSSATSNQVTTNIAAVVTGMEPNGILALSGRTNVNINGNVTGVEVTGYARPQDIGPSNTISSDQLADSNIQYVGTGSANSAQHVPWLQGIVSKYSPF
jgi:flagellar L-ring protein precursor FlgH